MPSGGVTGGDVHQPADRAAGRPAHRPAHPPTATTTSPPRCRSTTGSSCAGRRRHIWAPEIHFINGKWYIYFAAGRSNDVWRIRMWVLENSSADPFTGTWVEKGRIVTHLDTFSLDATTFTQNGTRYLSWAQQDPAIGGNTNLYLAPMSNPWTISGTPARLSVPTLSWETVGYKVNEGPSVLIRNGKVFMTYSAGATDSNYCMGMLTASASSNLMNPASWSKKQQPVFRSNAATSQYGPGHNSFTVSEDGQSDILVYHDRNYRDISGDPLNDPNRRTRIQKLYRNADGTPNLGIPVPDGATPYRFRSYTFPDRFIRQVPFRGRIDADMTNLAESQFRIVTGLAGSGTVSLESTSNPGYYLRNQNYEIWLDRNDGTTGFRNGASFTRRPGQSDSAAVTFESVSAPGRPAGPPARTSNGHARQRDVHASSREKVHAAAPHALLPAG
ncbi:family 43 glycosylhydrolase [Nonomuraea sp. NPDC050202]|uniref:family 43 glycosylhydrolase n=1 Tax=Nonomuraea sp. NPDC050202 TaxID=3155035 RepID=UPI0033FBC071